MKSKKTRARAAPAAPPRTRSYGAWLILLAGVLVYANSLAGPLVFDDRATIVDNESIRSLQNPARVFTPPTETPVAGRPVVNLTLAVNYAIGGLDVTGYHVVNVAVHLACALLIFGIARRTLESAGLALAAALLWVVHPLNSEAVNYVTQRTESLMACFYLLTLYCGIRALEPRRRATWIAVAIAACALGMACKESMATAPVMVALYDRIFVFASVKDALRARWRLYAGLAAGWILLGILIATSPRTLSAGFNAPDAAPLTYLLNQSVMIAHYLTLVVWPRALAIYYGWPLPLTLADVWPQLLFVAALPALTVVALFRQPRLGFAGLWFFLTLAPTSSIVPIATEVGAERRMYLPVIAVIVLLVFGAARMWRALGREANATPSGFSARLPALALAIATVALGARTVARNQEYRSSLTLAETNLARWPTPAAHAVYGTELAAAGDLARAEAELRLAAPDYPPARYYLGTVLASRGQSDEALAVLQQYVAGQIPDLDQVLLARGVMGDVLMKRGDARAAAEQYRLIVAAAPHDLKARRQLAAALVRQQAFAEAIPHYRAVLDALPDDGVALGGLGVALASTGALDEAAAVFRRAVDAAPRNAHARQNLARALLALGRLSEAEAQAREALTITPDDPAARDLYARIRAAQGK